MFACLRVMIRVRLVRKLALSMNGVDVSRLQIGDVVELPEDRAYMMIAEGWAEATALSPSAPLPPSPPARARRVN